MSYFPVISLLKGSKKNSIVKIQLDVYLLESEDVPFTNFNCQVNKLCKIFELFLKKGRF